MGSFQIMLIIGVVIGFFIYDLYSQIRSLREKLTEIINQSPSKTKPSFETRALQKVERTENTKETENQAPDSDIQLINNSIVEEIKLAPVEASGPDYVEQFMNRFKQDRPMKIGGLVFILGVGRFLSYAIQNNWISPAMRIVLGIVTSIAMISFGRYKIPQQSLQGSYLVGLGSAVYVLSIYIGFKFFGFFGIPLGLGLIALQYFVMAYLSYRSKNHWINDVSLFFSMICPFIFSDGSGNIIGLFGYLSVHLLGNVLVSYFDNRSASRLMGVIYLGVYIVLGFLGMNGSMGNPALISIILSLVFALSLAEIWIGRIDNKGFSFTSLASISILGVGLFGYSTILSFNHQLSSVLYSSICLGFFIGYGALWYFFSVRNKQNTYSAVVGILSILFLAGLSYHHFSGIGLFISSIIISGAIQALITIVTKDEDTIWLTSIVWIIPFFLLAYNYIDTGASNYFLVSIYSRSLIAGGLALLFFRYFNTKSLTFSYITGSIVLLYFGLCDNFHGITRVIVLEGVSLLWVLVGYIRQRGRGEYLFCSLVSIALPSIYLFIQGISKDFTLFSLLGVIIGIIFLSLFLSNKLLSSKSEEEKGLEKILIGVGLLFIYLSVLYIIPNDYYTLAYTILSMLIYLIGTRYKGFYGDNKLGYSLFMIIPIATSIMLLVNGQTFMLVLTNLLLSMSMLWLRFDNENNENLYSGYILFSFALLYFWNFGYIGAEYLSTSSTAIAFMLIVFTIIGIIFYVHGKKHDDKEYRNIGAALILGVIARVLIVELREMSLIMRIITCLIIGGLLVGSGFIGNKKSEINIGHKE